MAASGKSKGSHANDDAWLAVKLGRFTMFTECSPAELAVASLVTSLRVPPGHVLMREGAADAEAMFIVTAPGQSDVVRHDRDVATLGRGDVVGEMALSGDGLRSAGSW